MRDPWGGGWARSLAAALLLGLAPTLSPARAQEDSKPEEVEAVDPYSRGERAALDRAGYVSFGPFPWCEGLTSDRIQRELGGVPMLWVETAHFRIGATLATYKLPGDQIEKRKLDAEIARVRELFPGCKPPAGKLDPWLRLHLYARRIESVHADLLRGFGVGADEFGPAQAGGPARLASGPWLGMAMKPTVLLCERRSTLARFVRLALGRDTTDPIRERLPGQTMFLGISAEAVRSWSQELDAALHAQVAADVALNLIDGFRDQGLFAPVWFKYGWAHVEARAADERFALYARSAAREERDAWKWEPRVQALVGNAFAPTWKEMAGWSRFEDLTGPGHLTAWSKVTWMLAQGAKPMRAYLLAVTEPLPSPRPADLAAFLRDRQLAALEQVFGQPPAQLEDAWRRWAAKPGARR
jgi:hypothetical protein